MSSTGEKKADQQEDEQKKGFKLIQTANSGVRS